MDKDQAAQKLHFVSDHFVSKANMQMCAHLQTQTQRHKYKYSNAKAQIHKYTNIPIHKYTNIQIDKSTNKVNK